MGTGAERSGGGEEMSARRVQVPQHYDVISTVLLRIF